MTETTFSAASERANTLVSQAFMLTGIGVAISAFISMLIYSIAFAAPGGAGLELQNGTVLTPTGEFLFTGWQSFIFMLLPFVAILIGAARNPIVSLAGFIFLTVTFGVSLSIIGAAYTTTSIVYAGLGAAGFLFLFGLVGSTTKINLGKYHTVALIALIGILALMIVSIFITIPLLTTAISVAVIAVMSFMIANDVQMIKRRAEDATESDLNIVIDAAFGLYLSFVNIAVHLLQLFGISKD